MPASSFLSDETAVTLRSVRVWAAPELFCAVTPPTGLTVLGPSCQQTLSRITGAPAPVVTQPPSRVVLVPVARPVTRSAVPPPAS
jgi:hypothetical protein